MVSTHDKRSYWKQHVEQWLCSGQSQKAYSEVHQLKLHQLVYWIGVFKPKEESTHSAKNGFIPVQVVASHCDATLKVCLANGLCVEGISESNLGLVEKLIEVLQ